jgi:hypothetical protein
LDGFISHDGHRAWHIYDVPGLPNGRKSTDLEWIDHLQRGKDWVFFTFDRRILKNPAEKTVLKSAGLHGFILARGFMKMPLNEIASVLLWKWPEVEGIFKSVDPAIYEIQVSRQGRLKPISY